MAIRNSAGISMLGHTPKRQKEKKLNTELQTFGFSTYTDIPVVVTKKRQKYISFLGNCMLPVKYIIIILEDKTCTKL